MPRDKARRRNGRKETSKLGRSDSKALRFNLRLGRRLKSARHGRDHAHRCRSSLYGARR